MKTLNLLKNIALAAVMMIASQVSAANKAHADKRAHNHTIVVHANRPAPMPRGHAMRPAPAPVHHCCQCRDCNKMRRELDKHMRRNRHDPRFSCRTCNDLHRMLNQHNHVHDYRR
ncbi:MAG: hypothetical protein KBT12_01315 [Bacteroidales bacterium]|nr:hypothetical protein [Candidatus Physcousia equi]